MIRTFIGALLLVVASGASAADTVSATLDNLPASRGTVRWSAIDKLGSKYEVALPHIEGANFQLFGLAFSHGLNLGCQGFGTGRIFGQIENEVKEMVDYVKNNIAGMAVNYLVYSVPALYSLYDHIQILRNFKIDQSLFTCSSIRQFASNQRIESSAKSMCLEEGNSDTYCQDAANLSRYVRDVTREEQARKEALTGSKGADAVTIVEQRIDDTLRGEGASAAALRKDFGDLMPRVSYVDGKKSYKPPKRSVGKFLQETSDEVLEQIDGWVRQPENKWETSADRARLEEKLAVKTIPPLVIQRLAIDRKTNPQRYQTGLSILTRQIAINQMKMRVAEFRALIYGVGAQTPEEELTKEDRDALQEALLSLEAEVGVYQARLDAEHGQGEREDAILGQ